MPKAVTRAAQVVGLLGGVAWVAAWFLWDGGDDPVELGLFWLGAALVTLFLLELGTLLVKRGLLALRLFVRARCRCCSGWWSRSRRARPPTTVSCGGWPGRGRSVRGRAARPADAERATLDTRSPASPGMQSGNWSGLGSLEESADRKARTWELSIVWR